MKSNFYHLRFWLPSPFLLGRLDFDPFKLTEVDSSVMDSLADSAPTPAPIADADSDADADTGGDEW